MALRSLRRQVVRRFVTGIVVLGVVFFVSSGTVAYWHAWVYLAILFIPMALVGAYFMRRDPELLRRRMQTREKEAPQRWCQALSALAFVPMLVLPGLDHRFGWSQMSVALVVAADVVVLLSYAFFFRVLRENSYAGRTVEVAVGQQVVQTGPYAVIRHPLYLAVLVLYLGTPLALGSYWSVLPVLVVIPLLVMRIVNEEQVLSKTLPGYEAYRERVRFRLIPYLW